MAYPYNLDYEAAKERAYKEPVLKTDRQMWKLMLFTYLTCGIYTILFFIPFSFDIDKVAPGREVHGLSFLDIAPTVTALMGIAPDEEWEGRSVV